MNPLLIFLGILTGLILLAFVAWLWLRSKIRQIVRSFSKVIGTLAEGLPAFRITLKPTTSVQWHQLDTIEATSAVFESLDYQRIGDFESPEMPEVYLRAFWHPQEFSYAVLYDHQQAGVFADLAQDLEDHTHLTVSCAPESGLDQPEFHQLIRLPIDLTKTPEAVGQLHEEISRARAGRQPQQLSAQDFESYFTQSYARLMDWRIERGSVTAAEVQRVAALGGMEAPNPTEIEHVQLIWRTGIAAFVENQIKAEFLKTTTLSVAEWEAQRDQIWVIHENLQQDPLIEELADQMVGDLEDEAKAEQAYQAAKTQLKSAFTNDSIRQGFVIAQSLLPESQRSTLIGSVSAPFPGDLYRRPEHL